MQVLRAEEEWARRLIATELGVSVHQHDDGSRPGMYDLEAILDRTERAAIEVAAVVDATATELWNVVNGGGRWTEPSLAGGWVVEVTTNARQLRRDLPPFLQTLEKAGITEFPNRPAQASPLAPVGVTRAHQSGTKFPGSIYVTLDLPLDQIGGYEAPTSDALAEWLGDFLGSNELADLRKKLSESGAAQRHAFVVFSGLSGAPFSVADLLMRSDASVPTLAPVMPREITDAWVVSTWDAGHGFRWSRQNGWTTFSKDP